MLQVRNDEQRKRWRGVAKEKKGKQKRDRCLGCGVDWWK